MDSQEKLSPDEEKIDISPIRYILSLFLILLLILWYFSNIKLDPEPKNVPSLSEVLSQLPEFKIEDLPPVNKLEDFKKFVLSNDKIIKLTADIIISKSCEQSKVCYAKALYYFVRDNLKYIPDPVGFDYIENPKEVLKVGGGDCESGSLLLASLLEAIGINVQFVFISNHVYLRIRLPE